jgi:L-lactate dehydrogenase complex protein LldG
VNAREEILGRVRAALAGAAAPEPVPRDYRRADSGPEVVARFAERVSDYRAEVHRVAASGLAAAITGTLARAATLVVPPDLPPGWLNGFPATVRRDDPPIPVSDLDAPGVSVLTGCAVAIAETGTIVLDTGQAQGRRAITLVPDHHVCVVTADQIVATVPEGLARLPDPTRPLTFISGPSATSDIELDRVEGVHGPRRLDVIIVARSASAHSSTCYTDLRETRK